MKNARVQGLTHYELFFFFSAGFKPAEMARLYGYNQATAYRAFRNFRKAQKQAMHIIHTVNWLSFKREKKVNTPDH